MTDKTLDEQVAECLGEEIHYEKGIIDMGHMQAWLGEDLYYVEGVFTQNIANCKKYIEPALIYSPELNLDKEYYSPAKEWSVMVHGTGEALVLGTGATEEMAYCMALLDLKARMEDK